MKSNIIIVVLFTYLCSCDALDEAKTIARKLGKRFLNFADRKSPDNTSRAVSWILTGTKWCGAGNIAKHKNDFGRFEDTDRCCQAHDFCEPHMNAGQTQFGITNDGSYTKLHCDCDEAFRKCLRNVKSGIVATVVGYIYFNVIGTQCFKEEYPVLGCNRRGGWFGQKCLEYKLDKNGRRSYDWFDEPNYK